MEERRKRLEELFKKLPDCLPLGISPLVREPSWEELEERRKESRNRGVEGPPLPDSSIPFCVLQVLPRKVP